MLYLHQDSIISELKEHGTKDKFLHQIILYGSFTRNEHGPDSDIDILIITENIPESEKIFSKFRDDVYFKTSVSISLQYITPSNYINSKDPFIKQITKEGQIIWSINRIT